MSVLEVNGIIIPRAEIRAEAANLREEARRAGREVTLEEGLGLLEQAESILIDRFVLVSEAERRNITVTPEERDFALSILMPRGDGIVGCRSGGGDPAVLDEVYRRLRIDKLVALWCDGMPPPHPKRVREIYDRNRADFEADESVVVSHIICNVHAPEDRAPAEEKIRKVEALLAEGLSFAAAADQYSDCPGEGGNLGRVFRGHMVPAFDDVVFAATIGQVTPVFETEFGFHIALVQEHQPKGVLPFDAVRPEIEAALIDGMKERVLGKKLEQLRAEAAIRRIQL